MWKFIKRLFAKKTEWAHEVSHAGTYWWWKCDGMDFTIDKIDSGYRLWVAFEGRATFIVYPSLKQAKNAAKNLTYGKTEK